MKIIVDNILRIIDAEPIIEKYCKSNLEIDNPQYAQNERLGFPTYNIPRRLYWYEKHGNDYILPFGCFKDIYKIYPVKEDYLLKCLNSNIIYYKSNIKLFDYQEKAKNEALKSKNGVIVMPAGSGKTQTALQLISELGLKTLWITHTYDLLNQSFDRAKSNLESVGLGKIAAGKIDIGTHITFATVQTLVKLDLSQFKNEWDCIVVDEGHRICGTPAQLGMFYKVINALSCRYKYALTATPFRNIKGTEKALFSLIGPIICEVPKEVVSERTIKAEIQPIYTDFKIPRDAKKTDGTIDYSKLTTFLSENEDRNEIILDILKECKNNYTLVLGDRLTQLSYLQEKIGYGVKIDGTMTSKKKKAQREQYIQDMRDGKENLLFATYGLAKEGLDIPRLDRLILASPHRDKATIIQSVGRVERKFEGKKTPLVYDIVDDTQFHNNMFKSRKTIYRKNGNRIL
jgi:superfamily II DNA or RNA helicase